MRAWLRQSTVDPKTGRRIVEEMEEATPVLAWVADAAKGADVTVVTEHGLSGEVCAHAQRWLEETTGLCVVSADAIPGLRGGNAAGVMIIWDPQRLQLHTKEEVIMGRALALTFTPLGVEEPVATRVVGVYMRNRQDAAAAAEMAVLMEYIQQGERTIGGGDFNAEVVATGQVETTDADRVIRDAVGEEHVEVVSEICPTYRRAGTALDYWIATPDVSGEMERGRVVTGAADHDAVEVIWAPREAPAADVVEARRARPDLAAIARDDEESSTLRQSILQAWQDDATMTEGIGAEGWREEGSELEVGTAIAQWRALQHMMQEKAREAWEARRDDESAGEGGTGGDGGRRTRSTKELKGMYKLASNDAWMRGLRDSVAKAGGRGEVWHPRTSPFSRVKELKRELTRALQERTTTEGTRQRLIERTERMIERNKKAMERAQWAGGERLMAELQEAVASGNGTIVKMFRAIKAALSGNRVVHASQLVSGVYMDDDKKGSIGSRWKREAKVDERHTQRTVTSAALEVWLREGTHSDGTAGVPVERRAQLVGAAVETEQLWCEVDGVWYGTIEGGHQVDEPGEVLEEVAKAMGKQSDERAGFQEALMRVMTLAFGADKSREWSHGEREGWMDVCITWDAFDAAVTKALAAKGVGSDTFNAYALNKRLCPPEVRRHYYETLKVMIRAQTFPEEFHDWRCVLAMKKGEDPRVIHRRRDLWLVPHAQKLVARMVGREYIATTNATVPGSQGGFTEARDAPAMHIPLGIQSEICRDEARGMYRAFVDLGQFFSTIVREVQRRVEEWAGVSPPATEIMHALQDAARGSASTAHGDTNTWGLKLGVGQGCVNAAHRAKLQVALIQGAVTAICAGFDFSTGATRQEGQAVPAVYFADDGALMADTLWGLQLALDTCWWVTHVAGLSMIVKEDKSKTAWQGACYENGVLRDIRGYTMRLPNGAEVPQITMDEGPYTHLGFGIGVRWGGRHEAVRSKAVRRAKQAVAMIGMVPSLTLEQLRGAIGLAVDGIVGYYGRAVMLRESDCAQVEAAVREVLATRGFGKGSGIHLLDQAQGGMGWHSVHARAVAAYMDEMTRIIGGGLGEPTRVAVMARLRQVAWRLGCRTDPVEWYPAHLRGYLNEDDTIEAMYAGMLRARVRMRRTGMDIQCEEIQDALRAEESGGMIWEGRGGTVTYVPQLASRGAAYLADVYEAGGVAEWDTIRKRYQLGAWVREAYEVMAKQLQAQPAVQTWCAQAARDGWTHTGKLTAPRNFKWGVRRVTAARRTADNWGGWEYRVRWDEGGMETWEGQDHMGTDTEEMQHARESAALPANMYEWAQRQIKARRWTAAQWRLATTRRAETAKDAEERAAMEHAVAKAWRALETHAKEGQRGGSTPTKNMMEFTTTAGWRGRRWERTLARQVVFGGKDGGKAEDGSKAHRKPSSGRSDKQEGQGQEGVSAAAVEMAKGMQLWRDLEAGGERQVVPGCRQGTEFGDGAMRNDDIGRLMIRVDLLEDSEGVQVQGGVRVRMDKHEISAMNKGLASTKAMGKVMMEIAADNMAFDIIAAVDGSREGEGDDKRVSYGRWRGPSPPHGQHGGGESDVQGRMRVAEGISGGRLPGTWDNEDAEAYAILQELREAAAGPMPEITKVMVLSDALSILQAIDGAYWGGRTGRATLGKCGMMIEEICTLIERLGTVALVYMPAHVGLTMSAVADAAAKAYLHAPQVEAVSVGVGAQGRGIRYEVQGSDDAWAVLDRPTYRMVKDRCRVWESAAVARPIGCGHDMGEVAKRMGKVKDTHTEEEEKLAKKTAEAGGEDGKRAMMRARQDENVRHIAVWTAREGGTRLVEGGRSWWRDGRGCSVTRYAASRRKEAPRETLREWIVGGFIAFAVEMIQRSNRGECAEMIRVLYIDEIAACRATCTGRSLGIGRRMMHEAIGMAGMEDCEEIHLRVRVDDAQHHAMCIYREMGMDRAPRGRARIGGPVSKPNEYWIGTVDRAKEGADEWDVTAREDIQMAMHDSATDAHMDAGAIGRVVQIFDAAHRVAADGHTWQDHNANARHVLVQVRRTVAVGPKGCGGAKEGCAMGRGEVVEVWDSDAMAYRKRRIVMVRHGMPVISDMGQVATVEEGRYAHLTQDVDSMGGAQWMRLQAVEWRWPAESKAAGAGAARTRGRELTHVQMPEEGWCAPATHWDVWVGSQPAMRADADMRREREHMLKGLRHAKRLAEGNSAIGAVTARMMRGAVIALTTGQGRWRSELMQVVGGTWRMADETIGARKKHADAMKAMEEAVRGVQRAAGAMLARWRQCSRKAVAWANRREVGRERMRVVLYAWREVRRRRDGWWRHSSRVGRERQGTEDCSDELTPRWMEEWSYRPGLSAVMPGTVAGWLLGYARTNVEMRRSSRKQWAAWWVRMMGRDGEDWGGLYRDAVRQGKRPVKTGAEEMWDRWCGMNRGKEVEVQGVQVRRHGQRVWIAGGDARMVRRVVRVEKQAGETWVMRAGRGRNGEGSGGVWRGAAAYRKQGARRARIGGRLRLDAATLGRMLSGLGDPFGDG